VFILIIRLEIQNAIPIRYINFYLPKITFWLGREPTIVLIILNQQKTHWEIKILIMLQ
jgi:hypothetical protein